LSSGSHLDWQDPTEYLEIAGDGGQVVVDNAVELRHTARAQHPTRMIFPGEPTRVWRPNYTPIGGHVQTFTLLGYVAEVQHFAACLLEGRPPEVTIQDGYAAMRVCRALFDSRGRPVQLKDVV
jgi:predicted dehydrogenase